MSLATASAQQIPMANVIELINASAVVVAILACGFTLIGIVAVWRMGKGGAGAYFRMFERLQVLQLLTVMLVIASATVLAMLGILNSNGITGILSGVAGYVLGGLNSAKTATPPAARSASSADTPPAGASAAQDDAGTRRTNEKEKGVRENF